LLACWNGVSPGQVGVAGESGALISKSSLMAVSIKEMARR